MLIQNVLQEDTWVDHYRIVRKLGRGGFGITYLAQEYAQAESGGGSGRPLREVALKEYFPRGIATRPNGHTVAPIHDLEGAELAFQHGLKAFYSEAEALAQLEHENIVQIHRVFERNGTAYFVMPFLKGESLKTLLKREGTLSEERTRRLLLPVLTGLAYAHSRGILHRDVKPDNVMIRESDGRPVLIDFGTARAQTADDAQQYTRYSELVAYTPGYAAFEQYGRASRQNLHGPQTDVYSFAAMLYECVSGEAPVESATRVAEMHDDKADPLVPASARLLDSYGYSRAFLCAIDWGLELISKDRPQNLNDLRKGLDGKLPPPQKTLRRIEEHGASTEPFTQPAPLAGQTGPPPYTAPATPTRVSVAPASTSPAPGSNQATQQPGPTTPAAAIPAAAATAVPPASSALRRHAPLIGGAALAAIGLVLALLSRSPTSVPAMQPPVAASKPVAPPPAASVASPAVSQIAITVPATTGGISQQVAAQPAAAPQPPTPTPPKPPPKAAGPKPPKAAAKPRPEHPPVAAPAPPSEAQLHLWSGHNISTSSARRQERLSEEQCAGQPTVQVLRHEMEGGPQLPYGESLKLYVYFRFCGPSEIKGRMQWRVLFGGRQLVADDDSQKLERGEWRTALKVKVPDGAAKGRYVMETRFLGDVPFIDTAEFSVTGAKP